MKILFTAALFCGCLLVIGGCNSNSSMQAPTSRASARTTADGATASHKVWYGYCNCGWSGEYRDNPSDAMAEVRKHNSEQHQGTFSVTVYGPLDR